MIVSDAPNCGITYDRHYDDHNSFIIQPTDWKGFPMANPLAYWSSLSVTKEKSFVTLAPGGPTLVEVSRLLLLRSLRLHLRRCHPEVTIC
jgi:hypothetical protein